MARFWLDPCPDIEPGPPPVPRLSPPTRQRPAAPRLFALAWPLFLELLLGIGVGVAGTLLAARISDTSGAAFALANHVAATLFLLFRIVGAGVGVVLAQNLGGGQRAAADAVARAALGASSWIGGLTALAAFLAAAPLLRLMNAPPEVLPLALPLLQVLAPTCARARRWPSRWPCIARCCCCACR